MGARRIAEQMQIFRKNDRRFRAAQSGAMILCAHDPLRSRLMVFRVAVMLNQQHYGMRVMINRV